MTNDSFYTLIDCEIVNSKPKVYISMASELGKDTDVKSMELYPVAKDTERLIIS